METPQPVARQIGLEDGPRFDRFEIGGLFGKFRHEIEFPKPNQNQPSVLILAGLNGVGKTTILRMLDGLVELDFDPFRAVPFDNACLSLTTGDALSVRRVNDSKYPLEVSFREHTVRLVRRKTASQEDYTADHRRTIDEFRASALPLLQSIHYSLIDVSRSLALMDAARSQDPALRAAIHEYLTIYHDSGTGPSRRGTGNRIHSQLSERVRQFLLQAQLNYRQFFSAHQLDLLPNILERIRQKQPSSVTKQGLLARLESLSDTIPEMARIGLETGERDIRTLKDLLSNDIYLDAPTALAVLEAYVEMQERGNQSKTLIVERVRNFENIMDDFLSDKTIRVDVDKGLIIKFLGHDLGESKLSSGEYHFLYMMVSALLAYRTGTVIAIDEPELSLHVSWQRKIVRALARCASGASPLFIFATHSASIYSQYTDSVVNLNNSRIE